jgi:peptidoglycan/LPS O-acetylase OafA/YrhL
MSHYYPVLHSLRGFAAIWVMLFHVWFFSGEPKFFISPFLNMGWMGVHIFYVLSAFLLGGIYFSSIEKGNWNIWTFYKKRFLRIFPAYYFQLIILLVIIFLGYYKHTGEINFMAHLFMFFNLPPLDVKPLNGVWWTLPIEFAFYLILPLLVILLKKVGVILFLFLSFGVTLAYRIWVFQFINNEPNVAIIVGQLPGVLMTFSLGLSFSYLVYKDNFKFGKWQYALLAFIVLIFWSKILLVNTKAYWSGDFLFYYWESFNSFLIMAIIVSIYKTQNLILTNNVFVWFGKVSYGIYLWHLPILIIVSKQVSGFLSLLLITLPITLVLASLSYYLIENKFSVLK